MEVAINEVLSLSLPRLQESAARGLDDSQMDTLSHGEPDLQKPFE